MLFANEALASVEKAVQKSTLQPYATSKLETMATLTASHETPKATATLAQATLMVSQKTDAHERDHEMNEEIEKLRRQVFGKHQRERSAISTARSKPQTRGASDFLLKHRRLLTANSGAPMTARSLRSLRKQARSRLGGLGEAKRKAATAVDTGRSGDRSTRQQNAINNILLKCTQVQAGTQKDLVRASTARRRLRRRLTRMQGTLEKEAQLMSKRELAKHMKTYSYHKQLFIYGKNGLGRFLNARAQDVVQASDRMSKTNPIYKFLTPQLQLHTANL